MIQSSQRVGDAQRLQLDRILKGAKGTVSAYAFGRIFYPIIRIVPNVEKPDALDDEAHFCIFVHVLLIKHGLFGLKIRSRFSVEAYGVLLDEPACGRDGKMRCRRQEKMPYALAPIAKHPQLRVGRDAHGTGRVDVLARILNSQVSVKKNSLNVAKNTGLRQRAQALTRLQIA